MPPVEPEDNPALPWLDEDDTPIQPFKAAPLQIAGQQRPTPQQVAASHPNPARINPLDMQITSVFANKINKYARHSVILAFEHMGGVEALAETAKSDPKWFYEKLYSKLVTPERAFGPETEEEIETMLTKLDRQVIDITPQDDALFASDTSWDDTKSTKKDARHDDEEIHDEEGQDGPHDDFGHEARYEKVQDGQSKVGTQHDHAHTDGTGLLDD